MAVILQDSVSDFLAFVEFTYFVYFVLCNWRQGVINYDAQILEYSGVNLILGEECLYIVFGLDSALGFQFLVTPC